MSHFSVVVITEQKPTQDVLGELLAPYHEFECTGVDDEHVVTVDETEKVKADYENHKLDFKTLAGFVSEYYGKAFVEAEEDIMSKGGDIKEKFKYGYAVGSLKDNVVRKVVVRTNQEAKWDWWVVGGRWSGFLDNYNPHDDPSNVETCEQCNGTGKRDDKLGRELRKKEPGYTCNGCAGKGTRTKWPTQWKQHKGDSLQIKNVPLVPMREKAEREALRFWDKAHKIIAGRHILTWEEARAGAKDDIDLARERFNSEPVVKDLRKAKLLDGWSDGLTLKALKKTRNEYGKNARASTLVPFAILKDGKWYERGEMGWWGVVLNGKEADDWNEEYAKLLDGLSPDTWLTVVDCHI
jgi:hypothetical protein